MTAKEEFLATKNNLLMQIPRLSKAYTLEFEIYVRSFPVNSSSILQMTTLNHYGRGIGGSGISGSGSTPAFFLSGADTSFGESLEAYLPTAYIYLQKYGIKENSIKMRLRFI